MTHLTRAVGLGVVAGSRSLLGPALLARALAPRAAGLLGLAAAGEIVADKMPWIPARTAPLPLLGRVMIGAALGALVAPRGQRLAAAGAASAAAGGAAYLFFSLRRAGVRRGIPDAVLAATEDAVAFGLGRRLVAPGRSGLR